jgi:AcrR family transcriptional regulator
MRRGGADSAHDRGAGDDLLRRALASDAPDDETASRILTAAFDQAEDFGLRRFTMDDVARRVGVSRVTIYRYFPKKDQLINALLMRELRRFLTKLDAVIEAESTSEAKLSEGLLFCLAFLRAHRVLNRLLRTEPELILPYLTTKADTVVAAARGWIARLIRGEVAAGRIALPEQDIEMLAELLVRTVISLVITPETVLPVDSPEGQRRLVELYVKPLVAAVRPPSTHSPMPPSVPPSSVPPSVPARGTAVVSGLEGSPR